MQNQTTNTTDEKVKNLMDRTPRFLKSKIMSVLGNSNDLINGLTTKLDISLNLSTSSESDSLGNETNQSTNKSDDMSLDEHIIDFESRKIKERRAYDEVSSGRYRHPNFVTKHAYDDYNMIDVNPESSISKSNSSITKSPTIATTGTDELNEDTKMNAVKKSHSKSLTSNNEKKSNNSEKENEAKGDDNSLALCIQSPGNISVSENDLNIASISAASSDVKLYCHSESDQSCGSLISLDSKCEDEAVEFMRRFVNILFQDSTSISLELKSEFGEKSRTDSGRLWFARLVSAQRSRTKRVNENTFFSLIQYFAIILFECNESDDFSPAKILMNMCFTFFYEVDVPGCEPYREYLYTYLRDQPIWHTLRFWNAAFFDAVQCERSHRPVPQTHPVPRSNSSEDNLSADSVQAEQDNLELIREDQQFQQNISFGQLSTFTCNMHAFGLNKELCDEFLRKQCVIGNLSKEQQKMLYDNINRMYKETAKWRN